MDGFKAYKYYMAIKLHFTSEKYNVFENNGSVKGTRETFNSRNDRYIFEKIAMKYKQDKDVIQFFVSNFAYGNDTAVYGNGEAEELYTKWINRKQSITKVFIDDLHNIMNACEVFKFSPNRVFKIIKDELPLLTCMFISGKISVETMRIIDDIEPYLEDWKKENAINLVMNDKMLRIKKLTGFVKYDKDKLTKIYNHFKEELSL